MNMEDSIKATLENAVNAGDFAGTVTLVWHDGQVIQTANVGWRAIIRSTRATSTRSTPMPITSTAAGPSLHGDALGQVPGLVDVASP